MVKAGLMVYNLDGTASCMHCGQLVPIYSR